MLTVKEKPPSKYLYQRSTVIFKQTVCKYVVVVDLQTAAAHVKCVVYNSHYFCVEQSTRIVKKTKHTPSFLEPNSILSQTVTMNCW